MTTDETLWKEIKSRSRDIPIEYFEIRSKERSNNAKRIFERGAVYETM